MKEQDVSSAMAARGISMPVMVLVIIAQYTGPGSITPHIQAETENQRQCVIFYFQHSFKHRSCLSVITAVFAFKPFTVLEIIFPYPLYDGVGYQCEEKKYKIGCQKNILVNIYRK